MDLFESCKVRGHLVAITVGCASACLAWSAGARAQTGPIKVACVGEQTTHSDQLNRTVEYPAMLQKELGAGYNVQNFGDCCSTVLTGYPKQSETHPYLSGGSNPSFTQSLPFAPDIVVIGSWGKHDTEIANSVYAGVLDPAHFQADYEKLVTTYLDLPNKPTVYLSTPVPIPTGQPTGVTTTVILPTIEATAAKYHLTIVPLYDVFLNEPSLYKDTTHVTDVAGLQKIADTVFETMTGAAVPLLDGGVLPGNEGGVPVSPTDAGDVSDGASGSGSGSGGGGNGSGSGGGSGGGNGSGGGTGSGGGSGGVTPIDDAGGPGSSGGGGSPTGETAGATSGGCTVARAGAAGGSTSWSDLFAVFGALGAAAVVGARRRRRG